MRGEKALRVDIGRVEFNITLKRKITVLKGMSGTGKSTFVNSINDWIKKGRISGVRVVSSAELVVIDNPKTASYFMGTMKGCIFIVDEGLDELFTKDFADEVNKSDNYFLFISRSGRVDYLTYSVDSILEFKTRRDGTKYITEAYNLYSDCITNVKPDVCITEDSGSGYSTFCELLPNTRVISGFGKEGVYERVISELDKGSKFVCTIVDGAAFGSCIGRFDWVLGKICMIAPESFEFLLLNTYKVYPYVKDEVSNTSKYCDFDEKIISYERYYTELLRRVLFEKYRVSYSKSRLIAFFKDERTLSEIKKLLPQIDFN